MLLLILHSIDVIVLHGVLTLNVLVAAVDVLVSVLFAAKIGDQFPLVVVHIQVVVASVVFVIHFCPSFLSPTILLLLLLLVFPVSNRMVLVYGYHWLSQGCHCCCC